MAILAKALQPAKTQAIEETKKVFSEYNDFIFTEYRGLTVEQITALRNKLREHEAPLKVVKNNFARVAFEELKIENVADYLKGPTAVVMAKEDSNEAAKVLFDFAKDNQALVTFVHQREVLYSDVMDMGGLAACVQTIVGKLQAI